MNKKWAALLAYTRNSILLRARRSRIDPGYARKLIGIVLAPITVARFPYLPIKWPTNIYPHPLLYLLRCLGAARHIWLGAS